MSSIPAYPPATRGSGDRTPRSDLHLRPNSVVQTATSNSCCSRHTPPCARAPGRIRSRHGRPSRAFRRASRRLARIDCRPHPMKRTASRMPAGLAAHRSTRACRRPEASRWNALRSTAAPASPLQLSASLDLGQLEALVRERTPALQSDALEVDLAPRRASSRADSSDNPTADAGWGTIPVGRTNPHDLSSPLSNVPNYSAGLVLHVPDRKARDRSRSGPPRWSAAPRPPTTPPRAAHALELARLAGAAATAAVRLEGLHALASDDQRSVTLAESRLSGRLRDAARRRPAPHRGQPHAAADPLGRERSR